MQLHTNRCTTMLLYLAQQQPSHFFALSAFKQISYCTFSSLPHVKNTVLCMLHDISYTVTPQF